MKLILLLITSFLFSSAAQGHLRNNNYSDSILSSILLDENFKDNSFFEITIYKMGCFNRDSIVLDIRKLKGQFYISGYGKFLTSAEGGSKWKKKYKQKLISKSQIDSLVRLEKIIKLENGIADDLTTVESYSFKWKNEIRRYEIYTGHLVDWEGILGIFYK